MQINRLFEIVYVLLRQNTITAGELAGRFGVSCRTIYRDVDTLSLAGVPIYTEKGKGGGIRLLPGFVLDRSVLSEGEQNEILTALQGLVTVRSDETDRVLRKLSDVFNMSTRTNWLEVDFTDWSFSNGGLFHGFKQAILERRVAEFDYYSTFGEMTRRSVEPAQLWFKHRSWYVRAFCRLRQDERLFKLTRIRNLVITDEFFGDRELPETQPLPVPSEHHKQNVTLKMRIAPEMAFRVFDEFGGETPEKQPDGSYIVDITWPEDDWVYGFILSFGEFIEVLEPEHIKHIIRQKAEKIMGKYV